jgi:hypothetical protein
MATQTNININVKVDDKQVNKAVQSTENLRKEIKRLEAQLTTLDVNDPKFGQLSDQLKDNRDQLELVRAKSRDLFESFSLLPGPIGAIGSATDQSLGKLKILSSFNLKDVKGQFKAIGDDVKLVAGNIGKATGITKLYEATVGGLSKAFTFFGASAKGASTAAQTFGKALIGTGILAIVSVVGLLVANFDSLKNTFTNLFPGLAKMGQYIGGLIDKFTDFVGITKKADREAKNFVNGLEKGLKKEKESWDANADKYDEFTQRKVNANLKFKEKQIEILNDETKNEKQKNALIKQYRDQADREIDKADKDRAKKSKDAAKQELATKKQTGDQLAQQDRQRRQEEQDAIVQNLKNGADTEEKALRAALKKQQDIRNEGKTLTKEQLKLQADELNKIVKDELQKDIDDRQKAFEERVKLTQEAGQLELDALDNDIEAKKIKYGEDSKEYRDAQQSKFNKQFELLTQEENTLKEKEKTKDGLTQDEKNRLKSIQNERVALTNTVNQTNKDQVQSDTEKFLKTAEEAKKAKDTEFADKMKAAGEDFALQQQILDQKLEQDKIFYEKLLAQENLTAEQRKKIQDDQTANAKANAEAQISIEQKKFDAQQKLLMAVASAINAVADIAGKNTVAGKALAVAATSINTFAAIAGQLRASTASPGAAIPGYAIAQAIATGLVGFKAVADIIKTPVPGAGGGGGGGTPQTQGTAVPRPRGMATGGLVQGIGGPKSDLIPAMLSNGESVINAQSTSMFRPLLSSINAIGGGKRFADGGLAVGSFSQDQALSQLQSSMAFQQTPIKTYVVASDMSNQQMLDRNIKTRSTI